MELMTRWTDDRMDDLKNQVDELGRRMDRGFAEIRQEVGRTQEMIVGLHAEVNGLHAEVNGLHAHISRLSVMLAVAVIGLVAAQTGFILTQL